MSTIDNQLLDAATQLFLEVVAKRLKNATQEAYGYIEFDVMQPFEQTPLTYEQIDAETEKKRQEFRQVVEGRNRDGCSDPYLQMGFDLISGLAY